MVKDTQAFYRRIIMADIIKKREDSYETGYIGDYMEKIGSQREDQQESRKGLLKKMEVLGVYGENRDFSGKQWFGRVQLEIKGFWGIWLKIEVFVEKQGFY